MPLGKPLIPATKAQKHQTRTKFLWDLVPLWFRGILKRELLQFIEQYPNTL